MTNKKKERCKTALERLKVQKANYEKNRNTPPKDKTVEEQQKETDKQTKRITTEIQTLTEKLMKG